MYPFGIVEGILALIGFFYITKKSLDCSDKTEFIQLDNISEQYSQNRIN